MHEVVFYTTIGCHLCEKADAMLQGVVAESAIKRVDVGEDDALIARYGKRIPVLAAGEVELDWPFSLLDIVGLTRT